MVTIFAVLTVTRLNTHIHAQKFSATRVAENRRSVSEEADFLDKMCAKYQETDPGGLYKVLRLWDEADGASGSTCSVPGTGDDPMATETGTSETPSRDVRSHNFAVIAMVSHVRLCIAEHVT